MTGAWQVGGRSKIDYPERVDIDVDYVHRKSTTVDLAILLKTPVALLDWRCHVVTTASRQRRISLRASSRPRLVTAVIGTRSKW